MPYNEVVEHADPTVLQAKEGDHTCAIFSSQQSCSQDSTEESLSWSPYPEALILLEAYVSPTSYREQAKPSAA